MADQTYPPVGDPNRFDAIVERGTQLQRRRRGTAVGAFGSFVVVLGLAAVVLAGRPGTSGSSVVADGTTDTKPIETTTTEPSTDVTAAVRVDGGRITVSVVDPAQPVSDDSQQCVHASLFPTEGTPSDGSLPVAEVAEGSWCSSTAEAVDLPELHELVLTPTSPVAIGCAATQSNVAVEPDRTAPVSSDVTVTAPDLAPGTYRLVITVSSGIGDGCLPEPQPYERRAETTSTIVID